MNKIFHLKAIIAFCLSVVFLYSCRKDTPIGPVDKPERGTSMEDLLKDSVYSETYYLYLWQDQLPAYGSMNPREFKTAEDLLENLKTYSKDHTGKQLDMNYSFLDRSGAVKESFEGGMSGSFGFDVRYNNDEDLYVKQVFSTSPAGQAGIKRGWQIMEINGNSKLDYATFEADNFNFLFNALDAPTIMLKLKNENGIVVEKNITRSNFQIQPVLHEEVYTVGAKKVGYFALESFISTRTLNGGETFMNAVFKAMISRFVNQGVSEMIVDLRYNGGGAVNAAEDLTNLLVPNSANGKLMYTSVINNVLAMDFLWREVIFPDVNVKKSNTLELNRIYFLVTESTASASELLINNLKPFMDVQLIGEERTYGKPVGFFAWSIMNVDLYAVSFETKNNKGEGGYYDGMEVNVDAYDDVSKNWGDPQENLIKQAIHHIETGSYLPNISLLAGMKPLKMMGTKNNINAQLNKRGNSDMYIFGKEKGTARKPN